MKTPLIGSLMTLGPLLGLASSSARPFRLIQSPPIPAIRRLSTVTSLKRDVWWPSYLLFDDDIVFVHRHDNQGVPNGAWRVSGAEAAKPYVALAEYLLSNSQSLEDFLATHIH